MLPVWRLCRLRWTVVGKPRVFWEAQGTFDGVSKFKLDKEGKIYEHQVWPAAAVQSQASLPHMEAPCIFRDLSAICSCL